MQKHSEEESELKAALKFMASEGQSLIMTVYHYKGEPRRHVAAATEAAVLGRGHGGTDKQVQYPHGILSSWLWAAAGQGALEFTGGWCRTWLAPSVWLLVCTLLTNSLLLDIDLFPSF